MTETVELVTQELQVGWVYQDKRGIDVLIFAKRFPVDEESQRMGGYTIMGSSTPSMSSIYPYKGVALGNEIMAQSYAGNGKFSLHHDEKWECDLLLETGKPWLPVVD